MLNDKPRTCGISYLFLLLPFAILMFSSACGYYGNGRLNLDNRPETFAQVWESRSLYLVDGDQRSCLRFAGDRLYACQWYQSLDVSPEVARPTGACYVDWLMDDDLGDSIAIEMERVGSGVKEPIFALKTGKKLYGDESILVDIADPERRIEVLEDVGEPIHDECADLMDP